MVEKDEGPTTSIGQLTEEYATTHAEALAKIARGETHLVMCAGEADVRQVLAKVQNI